MKQLFAIIFILIISSVVFGQEDTSDSCSYSLTNILVPYHGDKLYFNCSCEINTLKFFLYNKGQLIYETTTDTNSLDFDIHEKILIGSEEKNKHPVGRYYWIANYSVNYNSKITKQFANGEIAIVR